MAEPADPQGAESGRPELDSESAADAVDVRIGAEAEADEGGRPVGVEQPSFFQHLPQFVIFPLVLVVVAVLIIVFFEATVEDSRPVSEVLNDIQHGWRKEPAAFDLALRARELRDEGRRFTEAETQHLIRILKQTEDADLRAFLVQALGVAGTEELALTELLNAAARAADNELERVHVVRGLGLTRSPRALAPLVDAYDKASAAELWELRLNTIGAIENVMIASALSDRDTDTARRARACLRRALGDSEKTVSWNAAMVLARVFRDEMALNTLHRLLDRGYLGGESLEEAHVEVWMAGAIDALAEIGHDDSRELVAALEDDRSMKVRNAVFKYLKRNEERARSRSEPANS